MNFTIALIVAISLGAALFPLFLRLIKKMARTTSRHSANIKAETIKINWPSLNGQSPSEWELTWRWAGWRRGLPILKRFIYCGVILFFILIFANGQILGALAILFLIGAVIWLKHRAHKARQAFIRQLPDAISSLVDTLRSGLALPQAIRFAAEELTEPVKNLFKALSRGQELNLGWEESLRRTATQLNLPEWTMVAETLIAEERLGGDVIPLLQESANTLRDRQKVEDEIKTLTAAGRTSGLLIAGLVPAVLLFFWLASPSYVQSMFTTGIGRMLLMVAFALELIGFLWIKKIIKIDY